MRAAVVIDAGRPARWIAEIIKELQAATHVQLCGVACAESTVPRSGLSWIYHVYLAVDRRLFATADDPCRRVSMELRDLELEYGAPPERWSQLGLDVIIDLRDSPDPDRLQSIAPCWFFDVGGAALLRPMQQGEHVTSAGLWEARLGNPCLVLRSYSATDPVSLKRNQAAVLPSCVDFVSTALRRLAQDGVPSYVSAEPERPEKTQAPGALSALALGLRVALRLVQRRFGQRGRNQWSIAIRSDREGRPFSTDQVQILQPPPDRFYADPFLLEAAGRRVLLFEDYRYAAARACISWCEINGDGQPGEVAAALERPYHLSYPFVFEWEGRQYMLPETAENRTVELYVADSFPNSWHLERTLMRNVEAYDPTLLEHDGRYWLFVSLRARGGSPDEALHAFHAETPLGPWNAHPMNPLVTDVRRARPAGSFFRRDGELIRPSQDGSVLYGYAMTLNRVMQLSPESYAEEPIERIEPSWFPGAIGTHTLSRGGGFEAIDVKRVVQPTT